MARWEPDARGRLEKAAMELFEARGYERTTVEDIAAHAGLTERTFFRHFPDKREVLFSGSKDLETSIVLGIEGAPKGASPLDAVAASFEAVGAALEAHRDLRFVRARYALVTRHAEIQERELIKLAALAAAATKALHARGVTEPIASLVAEAGVAVFKVGFERWMREEEPHDFAGHIREAVAALRAAAAPTAVETAVEAPRASPKKRSVR